MSEALLVRNIPIDTETADTLFEEELLRIPKGVVLYEINGPLFFGASRQFQDTLENIHTRPKALIIRMRYVPFIDITGAQRLKELLAGYKKQGVPIILSGVSDNLRNELNRQGIYSVIPENLVCSHINQAIEQSYSLICKGKQKKQSGS